MRAQDKHGTSMVWARTACARPGARERERVRGSRALELISPLPACIGLRFVICGRARREEQPHETTYGLRRHADSTAAQSVQTNNEIPICLGKAEGSDAALDSEPAHCTAGLRWA